MTMIVLQQQMSSAPASGPGPWDFWTAEQIAAASVCPVESVRKFWPLLWKELDARGVADRNVCAAVIGTIAVETASTFCPVREAYYLFEDEKQALRDNNPTYINPENEEWRRTHLDTSRYYPFYGRGFIQLTWNGPDIWNYKAYGEDLGQDLVTGPDLALKPEVAAGVMASFFVKRHVVDAARDSNWPQVRIRVQGTTKGIEHLTSVVTALGL